ncbi:glutathione S-transferase [Fusarium subglutinans]|uniref:glutathione transferase n=1 Tax=Gibberella subglutinans TaxID=42677 RepID=A0A8H5P8N0_GIBSU|nr:glutathione S-transferase [Fusarium subglutinans]KAF5591997.1 glutathione S-transferase [Fusarium subglutinans]
MALKLYRHVQSICTKRVRTVFEEKKLQYEFIVVDFLKGEHLSKPYGVEFHPFKKIPVLVGEESDIKGLSIELCYFDANVSGIAWEAIFKPFLGYGAGDEAIIKAKLSALDTALAGYERILSQQSYLGGSEITLADIFHLPYAMG